MPKIRANGVYTLLGADVVAADAVQGASTLVEGIVIRSVRGFFDVLTEEGEVRCTLRGKLDKNRLKGRLRPAARPNSGYAEPDADWQAYNGDWGAGDDGRQRGSGKNVVKKKAIVADAEAVAEQPSVAVGDRVRLVLTGSAVGVIEEVVPRKVERRMARKVAGKTQDEQVLLANLDLMCVVFAIKDPLPHFRMLDRFLITAEMFRTPAIIILNKADLGIEPEVAELAAIYRKVGYPVTFTSTQTGEGLAEVRQHLTDSISLFTGPSGVGKSALVASFTGADTLAMSGETSIFTGKGRHTTTSTRLIALQGGGFLADSPGLRELAFMNVDKDLLASYFPEMRPFLGHCTYADCHHLDEPGCHVKQAVADDTISHQRYDSYRRLMEG